MNESMDRRADQALSHLRDGLAAHVTVPPVTRVLRRATPLHRALFRLEDMAAELSVPPVPHVIRMATPRRRAVVAGCSICALGVAGAALVLVPGGSNGSFGPSELWAQNAEGSDSTSQSGELIMPNLPNDLVAQATNQQPPAPPVPAQLAAAKLAAAAPVAAKPATAKPAAARTTAARQAATQPRGTQLPPTTQRQVRTSTTLSVAPLSSATSGTTPAPVEVRLTATVSPPAAAGSVQFEVSGFGNQTVAVSNGIASTQVMLTPGVTYQLIAVFTPSNTTAYIGSWSEKSYTPTATSTAPASPAASLAAANTNATLQPTVTASTPPPVPQPLVEQPPVEQVPGRTGRGRSDRGGAASLTEQLPQQIPAEQPLVQRGRHH